MFESHVFFFRVLQVWEGLFLLGKKQRGVPQIWESHLLETNKSKCPQLENSFMSFDNLRNCFIEMTCQWGLITPSIFLFNPRENIAKVKGVPMTSRTSRRSLCMGCNVG